MFEARGQHQVAVRPGGPEPVAKPSARPNPYDLYIDLPEVQALWACGTDHPDELVYRCAFASMEMGFALLAEAARDARPAARRDARVEALAANLVEQAELARRTLTGAPLPATLLVTAPPASPGVRALRALGPEHASAAGRIADALLLAGFPVPLGLEPELARARAHHGLPSRGAPAAGPYLPYDAWAQPERVAALVERAAHSAEDRLFAGVHQMTECWLRIVLELFGRAERAVRDRNDWDAAAAPLERAADILAFLGRHIELLHVMVVADYHPLRVALRGASGAQSAAARVATASARQFLPPLRAHLGARGLALLDVLRDPHAHPGEHRYLEAVGALERRLTAFYFQHFQLARRVLGTKALGSLGYEVRALADRFIQPMFPELDDARYDHTMLTNLAHGGEAGRIIAVREDEVLPPPPPPPEAPVDPAVAREAVERYFDAIRAFDIDAWAGTFHPEGTMEDPVGSRPYRGLAELRVFFQGVMRTFARLDVRPGPLELRGAQVTARWRAEGTAYNGRPVAFEGTEQFDLAPDGRILAVRVWWDPAVLVDQLLAPAPAAPAPA